MNPGGVTRIAFLMLVTGFLSLPCAADKRPFTVADDIRLAHFGDPYTDQVDAVTFSPDGRYFVVDTERGRLDLNRPESTLWVYRTEEVHRFLLETGVAREVSPVWTFSKSTYKTGPIITHIRWLHDSNGLVFLAKTESGKEQLFLADLNAKTVEAMTPAEQPVTAFAIRDRANFVYSIQSPAYLQKYVEEGRATSLVATGRTLQQLLTPETEGYYGQDDLWAVVKGRRFRVEDKATGRNLPFRSVGIWPLELSPDGSSVVTEMPVSIIPPEWETDYPPPPIVSGVRPIKAGRQDLDALGAHTNEFVRVDLKSGDVRPLTHAPVGGYGGAGWNGAKAQADWSPNGRWIVLSNTFLPPPPKGRGLEAQLNRPCVAVINVQGGQGTLLEFLALPANTKSGYEEGAHIIQNVYFAHDRNDQVMVEYYVFKGSWSKESATHVHTNDGSWKIAAVEAGWLSLQDQTINIEVKEGLNEPPVLLATEKTTKTSRIILDPNPQLKDLNLGQASIYKWKDKTGYEWAGGLYKPADFVPGRRYPLVIQTHGFSENLFRPEGIWPVGMAARELAMTGILVLQAPDYYPQSSDAEEAHRMVRCYEAAVKQLSAEGLIDPARVGIVGFSRSCWYVMETLTSSPLRFRAAIITDGINVGYLQYLLYPPISTSATSFGPTYDQIIGAPPFGDGLQQWFQRSPEFKMDKVSTPLQIVAEGRWDVLFMWEPYAALRYLKKPVELILLNDTTHVLNNPAQRMVSQGGAVDWMRFWLQGYEDPDPTKAEQYIRWRELRKLQEANEKKPSSPAK